MLTLLISKKLGGWVYIVWFWGWVCMWELSEKIEILCFVAMVTLHWHFHKETNVWSEHHPHFHICPHVPVRDRVNWLLALISSTPTQGSAYFSWKICPL